MRDDVFHFLVVTLPEVLDVQSPHEPSSASGPNGRDVLLQIFSQVPFDMFKAAVESPVFTIGRFDTVAGLHVIHLLRRGGPSAL